MSYSAGAGGVWLHSLDVVLNSAASPETHDENLPILDYHR